MWKQIRYPSTSEWLSKRHYFHIMEYYGANKKNELKSKAKQNKTIQTIKTISGF